MGVLARSIVGLTAYILEAEKAHKKRLKGQAQKAYEFTTWQLGCPTLEESVAYKDLVTRGFVHQAALGLVRQRLKGWDNLKDKTGAPVPFPEDPGADVARWLTLSWILELAEAIIALVDPDEQDFA